MKMGVFFLCFWGGGVALCVALLRWGVAFVEVGLALLRWVWLC